MERFFITAEETLVEHDTSWELFFDWAQNKKSNPKELTTNKNIEYEQDKISDS